MRSTEPRDSIQPSWMNCSMRISQLRYYRWATTTHMRTYAQRKNGCSTLVQCWSIRISTSVFVVVYGRLYRSPFIIHVWMGAVCECVLCAVHVYIACVCVCVRVSFASSQIRRTKEPLHGVKIRRTRFHVISMIYAYQFEWIGMREILDRAYSLIE